MTSTKIDLHVNENIAFVTLNGPPRNEMNTAFFDMLKSFVSDLKGLENICGLIIQGAGRHFSSGADVAEIQKRGAEALESEKSLLTDNVESFSALGEMPYPSVAVVRGCCLGAGMELALACNYRIAEKNALFSLPEVTWGIMPGCGGTVRLPALVGKAEAVEMILTGRSVLADEAFDMGLIDESVQKGKGLDAAIEYIRRQTARKQT